MTRRLVPPRLLSDWERSVLDLLLSKPIPGYKELRDQARSVRISEAYDDDASVIFSFPKHVALPAPVRRRIPVEARGFDEDDGEIHVLLHVVDGRLSELEIYRPDGEPVERLPEADSLSLVSLDYEDQ